MLSHAELLPRGRGGARDCRRLSAHARTTPRVTQPSAHDKGYRNLRPHSPWLEDYHILQTTKDEYVLGAIRRNLEAAGVPVEFSKGEAGKGQHEINLDYTTAVEMADRNSIYKLAAKEIAHFNGRSVSFMAKYDFNDTGSSCHIHSSLWSMDGKTAVFDDHHGPHGMSETFQHYLAGLTARDAHPTDQLGAYAEVVAARTREQTLGGSVES